jgi:hypothetical protein
MLRFQWSFNNVFISEGYSLESCLAFSCCMFTVLFSQNCVWTFVILFLMRTTGQLFCKISPTLGLSNVSTWIDWVYATLAGKSQKRCYILPNVPSLSVVNNFVLLSLITFIVFDHLVRISARFFYCKMTSSLYK